MLKGLPYQTAEKLAPYLKPEGKLDPVLEKLKELNGNILPITEFEKEILSQVQGSLISTKGIHTK